LRSRDVDGVGILGDLDQVPGQDIGLDAGLVGERRGAKVTPILVERGSEIESLHPSQGTTTTDDGIGVDLGVANCKEAEGQWLAIDHQTPAGIGETRHGVDAGDGLRKLGRDPLSGERNRLGRDVETGLAPDASHCLVLGRGGHGDREDPRVPGEHSHLEIAEVDADDAAGEPGRFDPGPEAIETGGVEDSTVARFRRNLGRADRG
jgi:hypothetical protein